MRTLLPTSSFVRASVVTLTLGLLTLGLLACGSDEESDPGTGGSGAAAPSSSASGGGEGGGLSSSSSSSSSAASTTSSSGSTTSSGTGGGVCQTSSAGSFVLALSIQLLPARPLFFTAEVAAEGDHLVLELTALRTPYREGPDNEDVAPLTPVGEPFTITSDALGAGGELRIATGEILVVGPANPFSMNDLVATATLAGTACPVGGDPAGTFCGTVEGQITAPIALQLTADKNSFAMNLAAPGVIDCAGSPAEALP